jgi:prepilin peptidase CpaA
MDLPSSIATSIALAACVTDLRTRRIPNVLTFGAAAFAVIFHLLVHGVNGLLFALGGCATGVLLFFPLFALRGLGAGDVKLLAALGAWLGPIAAFSIALWGTAAGGVLALCVALGHGYLRRALSNIWTLLMHWRVMGLSPLPSVSLDAPSGAPRLAYAVPLTFGLMVTLWIR